MIVPTSDIRTTFLFYFFYSLKIFGNYNIISATISERQALSVNVPRADAVAKRSGAMAFCALLAEVPQ
jgi:hypothetical protein